MHAGGLDAHCSIKADASPVKADSMLQPMDPPTRKCQNALPARAHAAAPADAAPVYPEGCLIRRLLEARAAGVPFAVPPPDLCCSEAALVTQAGSLPLLKEKCLACRQQLTDSVGRRGLTSHTPGQVH